MQFIKETHISYVNVTNTPRIYICILYNLPIGAKAAANAEFEIMINADENFIFVFVLLTVVDDILSSKSLLLFLLHWLYIDRRNVG